MAGRRTALKTLVRMHERYRANCCGRAVPQIAQLSFITFVLSARTLHRCKSMHKAIIKLQYSSLVCFQSKETELKFWRGGGVAGRSTTPPRQACVSRPGVPSHVAVMAGREEVLTSDVLNYLVMRYLQESGFSHTAFVFGHESSVANTPIDPNNVPPGSLITFIQRGMQYLELEANLDGQASKAAAAMRMGLHVHGLHGTRCRLRMQARHSAPEPCAQPGQGGSLAARVYDSHTEAAHIQQLGTCRLHHTTWHPARIHICITARSTTSFVHSST